MIIGIAYKVVDFVRLAYTPANPENSNTVIIELRKGEGPNEIARFLTDQGVLRDPKNFIWLGRVTRKWKKLKVGEYEVSGKMTPMLIFHTLTSGVSLAHPLTLREGENLYELAEELEDKKLVSKSQFIALCKDTQFLSRLKISNPPPKTAEGYLFPDTYYFNKKITPEEIIYQMVRKFMTVWTPDFENKTKELGFNRHQIVTLASMIEKETGAQEERPMISSVFYNRLKIRMRLQSDPTTIYGIWERYNGNLKKADLLNPTPYNTYTIAALPPGPIGNPGKEALHAALYPAKSDYLYFVSHNDGTHEFTTNFKDHESAVRKFQMNRNARKGKSWRDLEKRTQAKPQR